MSRIIIEIDVESTTALHGKVFPITRTVVRSSAIKGLTEDLNGYVKLTIQATEESTPLTVIVYNSFDEIAEFMVQ